MKTQFTKDTFWTNTTGIFTLLEESDDFDYLLLKAVKEYANREAIAHHNPKKTSFFIRYEDHAYRIAENKFYGVVIGSNCVWRLDKKPIKKYSIAKIEYKDLEINNIKKSSEYERVVRDGKVGVVTFPNNGTSIYQYKQKDPRLLFSPILIAYAESNTENVKENCKIANKWLKDNYNKHLTFFSSIEVIWVEEGTLFHIEEDYGYEQLCTNGYSTGEWGFNIIGEYFIA